MISDRRTNRIWYNISTEKIIVTIESIECNRETTEAAQVLYGMFKSLVDDPRLIECGEAKVFEQCRIAHNGARWIMTMEALVPRI